MRLSRAVPPALKVPLRETTKRATRAAAIPSASLRLLPSYLIVGAQRCGTTTLYRHLVSHPAVAPVRLTKGVHYYDTNYTRSWAWYRSHFPTTAARWLVRRRHGVELITGEASPYYMFHPLVPERVAATLPGVKLVVLLRDPVERAYSHYQHEVARGFEDLPFGDALEREAERLEGEVEKIRADPGYVSFHHQHHSYVARGRYIDQIEVLHRLFGDDRVLVLLSERMFRDPQETFRRLTRFLGLPAWAPPGLRQYNAHVYDQMDPGLRRSLTAYFAPYNARLADLLQTDPQWSG